MALNHFRVHVTGREHGHTGRLYREQHFAPFLSIVCVHNEHRFLFCNMSSGGDVLEKDKPRLIMASFVALWSWGIFCLVFMWGKMRLSARSVRKRRLNRQYSADQDALLPVYGRRI